MATLTLDGVTKRFGDVVAVDAVSLEIVDEEFMVLVGPSGCGKSTLLRMIAGLEEIDGGTITIGERVVNDLPPKSRDIAMVFQNYALYPHMSVRQNLEFGLKMRRTSKEERERRVGTAARILGVEELLDRKPRQLSGGQRQRVAVGRAIVREPAVFLFDEPLSNLDAKLRGEMRAELTKLQRELRTTTVYVTHDQVEAMTMGHRIAVMKDGRVQQVDTPMNVYERPANLFVASFIGTPPMNVLSGTLSKDGDAVRFGDRVARTPASIQPSLEPFHGLEVSVGLRPERVSAMRAAPEGAGLTSIPATVEIVEPLGHEIVLHARSSTTLVAAKMPPGELPAPGDGVELAFDPADLHFFSPETGERLGTPSTASC